MCGRFAITLPSDAMAQLFQALPDNDLPDVPNFNVCPTTNIHVVTSGAELPRRLTSMRWGLIPKWYKKPNGGPLLINARSETVADKPAFRDAVRHRRALVVASGFYEWTKAPDGGKDPWYITSGEDGPLVMAAVWQEWFGTEGETLRTCALVTTSANSKMAKIHHRMPVILEPEDWPLWLGEAGHGAAKLLKPSSEESLQMHRVDRTVNSNRATGSALVLPLETHG